LWLPGPTESEPVRGIMVVTFVGEATVRERVGCGPWNLRGIWVRSQT